MLGRESTLSTDPLALAPESDAIPPDWSALQTADGNNENPEIVCGDPTVYHPSEHQQHPPHHLRNDKEKHFKKGADRVEKILGSQEKIVQRTGSIVSNINKNICVIGTSFSLLGSDLSTFGLGLCGLSLVSEAINTKVTAHFTNEIDTSFKALNTCKNEEAKDDDKKQAYDYLVKQSVGMRYRQHAKHAASTIFRFAVGEIVEFFTAAETLRSVLHDGFSAKNHSKKSKHSSVDSIDGALALMKDHILHRKNTLRNDS